MANGRVAKFAKESKKINVAKIRPMSIQVQGVGGGPKKMGAPQRARQVRLEVSEKLPRPPGGMVTPWQHGDPLRCQKNYQKVTGRVKGDSVTRIIE